MKYAVPLEHFQRHAQAGGELFHECAVGANDFCRVNTAGASIGPAVFAQPTRAPIDGTDVDDGADSLTGAWHDRGADGLARPGDDSTENARPDNVEFADVVDPANGLAESGLHRGRKPAPGDFAEQAVQAMRTIRGVAPGPRDSPGKCRSRKRWCRQSGC